MKFLNLMWQLLLFLAFYLPGQVYGQQGVVTNYLRLQPTTLPSVCRQGDFRYNTSTSYLSVCGSSNSWADLVFTSSAPLTTLGDTLYMNATPAPARLPGNTTTTKKYMSQTGTGTVSAAPAWAQIAFTDLSGTAATTQGGTGLTSYTLGDVPYSSAANTLSNLAGNTTSTKKFLTQTGTGTISAAPSWVQPACSDLSNAATSCSTDTTNASNISSGTLAIARGGTNSGTTLNNNRVMVSSGGSIVEASAITASKALASDSSGIPVASATTATELGYVSGVTSAIQTQLSTKAAGPGSSTDTAIALWNGTGGYTLQNSLTTINSSGQMSIGRSGTSGNTIMLKLNNDAGSTPAIAWVSDTAQNGLLFYRDSTSNLEGQLTQAGVWKSRGLQDLSSAYLISSLGKMTLTHDATDAATVQVTIKASASQSADILDFTDSSNNVLTSINKNGNVVPHSYTNAGLPTATGSGETVYDSTNNVLTYWDATAWRRVVYADSNVNAPVNECAESFATTATAAATTTLTVASAPIQAFTGSTTQNVVLPVATTLPKTGFHYYFVNRSSGAVTVKDAGSNSLQVMAASSQAWLTATNIGSSNGTWDISYTTNNAGGGTVTSVAMTVPTFLSISGSPVTTSGTLAVTLSGTALPVANGGTGLTSGTSGGVLAYTASGTLASSGALTANQVVIGGGAGVAPSSLAAGSQYQVLRMGASNPAYGSINLDQSAAITGNLGLGNGGTNANITAANGGAVYSTASALAVTAAGTSGQFLKSAGAAAPTWSSFTAPTIQKFTSSSGTYTTAANVLYIRVRMVGGGGGGGGSSTVAANNGGTGGTGGNTTFGSSLLAANGGVGGAENGSGGAGGTASLGTGPIGTAIAGGQGSGPGSGGATVFPDGGEGASSPLGGQGGTGPGAAGGAAIANSGSGGGGGGANTATSSYAGAGGGAGGWVDAIITSPAATYAYCIGNSGGTCTGGAAGSAGTSGLAGGAGGTGYIEVTEYYQ